MFFGAKQNTTGPPNLLLYIWRSSPSRPGVGALIGSRLLYPSQLRYAKSIALMLFSAAVGCVLEGLASPTVASAIGLSILATAGGGVYPAIFALLTPDIAPGKQGHLQGALYAVATLGSVAALGIYLALFNTTETFWMVPVSGSCRRCSLFLRRPFSYAAGERITVERGQAKHPVIPGSPPRRRTKLIARCAMVRSDAPSNRSRNSGEVSRHTNMHASKGTANVSSVSDLVSSYPQGIGVDRLDGVVAPAHGLHVVAPLDRLDGARRRSFTQSLELVAVRDDSDERAVQRVVEALQGPPARRRPPAVRSRLRWHCKEGVDALHIERSGLVSQRIHLRRKVAHLSSRSVSGVLGASLRCSIAEDMPPGTSPLASNLADEMCHWAASSEGTAPSLTAASTIKPRVSIRRKPIAHPFIGHRTSIIGLEPLADRGAFVGVLVLGDDGVDDQLACNRTGDRLDRGLL